MPEVAEHALRQKYVGISAKAVSAAAAIELIHTFSLIHDDIMDDDDMRRGQPSCHKKFGEANALLAGDALLTNAWSVAAQTKDIESELVIKAIKDVLSERGENL